MKDTLCAIISVFFKTALFFLCGMLVMILSPGMQSAGETLSLNDAILRISSHGAGMFFAALFMALVSTHFRIIRRPGKKTLTFALVFFAAFCALYGGLYAFGTLFPPGGTDAAFRFPLEEDKVTRADGVFVWQDAGKDTGRRAERAGPVVVMNRNKGAGNFRVYAEGYFDAKTLTLRLSPGDEEIPFAPAGRADTVISPFLQFFSDDIVHITDMLRPSSLVDIPALCSVFSLVFFGISLWTLAKLSRWPLFNLWFTLAAVWFVFSGMRFISLYLVPEILRFPGLARTAEYLPAAFPGFCGLILFLMGLLGTSLKEWRREMRYE